MTEKEKNDKLANACNPYCPLTILTELATDPDFKVRRAVINNPNCPSSVLKKAYKYEKEKYIANYNMLRVIASPNLSPKDTVAYFIEYRDKSGFIAPSEIKSYVELFDKMANFINDPNTPNSVLIAITRIYDYFFCERYYDYHEEDESKLRKLFRAVQRKAKKELFKRKIHGVVIPDEELTLDEKQEELERQRLVAKQKQEDIQNIQQELVNNLKRIRELIAKLKEAGIESNMNEVRIRIPIDELFIKVDDHIEINPLYLDYINFINFSYIPATNLKVSHIDWSGTNISIDPQTVYNRDLSYAKFKDDNIILKSFAGCNLTGTDISEELDSIGIEDAITDESTKVPLSSTQTK